VTLTGSVIAAGAKLDWVIANASSMTAIRVMRRNVTTNTAFAAIATFLSSALGTTTYTDPIGSGSSPNLMQGNVYEYKVEVDAA